MDSGFENEVRVTSNLISNFADSLSLDQFPQNESIQEGEKAILVNAITATHAAVIQIYDIPVYTDRLDALNRQRSACKHAMSVVEQAVTKLGLQHTPLVLGCTLMPVHNFLVGEAKRQEGGQHTALIQTEIDMIVRVTKRIKRLLPSGEWVGRRGPSRCSPAPG